MPSQAVVLSFDPSPLEGEYHWMITMMGEAFSNEKLLNLPLCLEKIPVPPATFKCRMELNFSVLGNVWRVRIQRNERLSKQENNEIGRYAQQCIRALNQCTAH